jgi:hypothetical protein
MRTTFRRAGVLILLAAIASGAAALLAQGGQTPSPQVPGTTARDAVEAAATALGGAERLRALRNITLIGYGQYAYQNGGGNITALPEAPLKLIAANDLIQRTATFLAFPTGGMLVSVTDYTSRALGAFTV